MSFGGFFESFCFFLHALRYVGVPFCDFWGRRGDYLDARLAFGPPARFILGFWDLSVHFWGACGGQDIKMRVFSGSLFQEHFV